MTKRILLTAFPIVFFLNACDQPKQDLAGEYRQTIKLHQDHSVKVYGHYVAVKLPIDKGVGVWNPVQIVRGPDNLMYVANNTGEIYSLVDSDGDGLEDEARLFCNVKDDSLRSPASIIFKDNELYVGTAQEVRVYTDQDGDGTADYSRAFFSDIPHSEHPYEWTSGLTFGADDHLYLVLTTDSWHASAAADPQGWRGAVLRISPDGKQVERYATGLRSVPAMVYDAHYGLLLVDNEGGGNRTEELIQVQYGNFYGHNPRKYDNPEVTEALMALEGGIAPSGMTFNSPENDFDGTAGDLIIGYYGPGERWNRGSISRVRLTKDGAGNLNTEEQKLVEDLPKVSDLEFGFQGDLYVTLAGKTDYWYQPLEGPDGAIYKIVYAPWVTPLKPEEQSPVPDQISDELLEQGQQLFIDRACSACHSTDGKTELLGPNLKYVGLNFSREELLEEIENPSARIKPSMAPTQITKLNGELLIGRVVNNGPESIQIMVTGNRIVEVEKAEIQHQETLMQSMMYEGLLYGMSEEQKDALLTYLESLHLVD